MSRAPYFSIGSRAGEIPELDGLRGLAIVLVLVRHAAEPIYAEYGHLLPLGAWDIAVPLLNGWMGVDLFFVLSGFLITHHLLKRWPGRASSSFALRYWAKRILRTFPAFYAAVAIALVGLVPLFDPPIADPVRSAWIHLLFVQDYFGSDLVAAFWSLGVEEKFYLFCPLLLLLLTASPERRRWQVIVLLAMLPLVARIALTLGAEFSSYPDFFWRVRAPAHLAMDGLCIGVLCALVYHSNSAQRRIGERARRNLFLASVATLAACLFSVAWFDGLHYLPAAIVINVVAVAFGGVLLAVCLGPTPIAALLRSRWLRVLSVLSYSLYLMHLMLVPAAEATSAFLLGGYDRGAFVRFLVFLPVFATLSSCAALVLHFAVEKPFLLLKDRISL